MENWRSDLGSWLAPLVAGLRHKTRARMCLAYIARLIGPGYHKPLQRMAAREAAVDYNQLPHFIASEAWDTAPPEATPLTQADRTVGGENSGLIADDTALPKKGDHSVGIAPQ